jgi:transcriptional regulator with XRE-family HTH domain
MKNARPKHKTPEREYALTRNFVALGAYLQEMRIKAGLTQRTVSLELEYSSAQFISNFERGIASPPFSKLKALIRLYKMPVEKVMNLVLEGERQVLSDALRDPAPRARQK